MIKELIARFKQGHRTVKFPDDKIKMPLKFRGLPELTSGSQSSYMESLAACPTGAFFEANGKISLDLGRCIFCGACSSVSKPIVQFTGKYQLATNRREDLFATDGAYRTAQALGTELKKLFGRSLKLRVVSAGGCGACEADCNVLQTPVFDLARFGIQFAASPRHADGILITGPVTRNMSLALQKTYDAISAPKIVIACGACAISGGIYAANTETIGIPMTIPVDLYIPGCPPHPLTILDGLLRLLGRINKK